MVKEETKHK